MGQNNDFISIFSFYLCCSHAALRFKTEEEAAQVLKKKDLMLRGKKIYVIPAYESVMLDVPALGKIQNDEIKVAADLVNVTDP